MHSLWQTDSSLKNNSCESAAMPSAPAPSIISNASSHANGTSSLMATAISNSSLLTTAAGSSGGRIVGNYILTKTLGEGNFAKVKLGRHRLTHQEVAVKILDKSALDSTKLAKLHREIKIMKLLHHPNIVQLYEVIETTNTIYLIMELVSGGELYDYLVVHGQMKEKDAREKMRQILSAVHYCHQKRVIHRDLKVSRFSHSCSFLTYCCFSA